MISRIYAIPLCFVLCCYLSVANAAADDFQDDDYSAGGSGIAPTAVILFMFFGLCLGIFTLQVISRIGESIPYTVIIFILGIIFSFVLKLDGGNVFEESINDWVKIDPEIMLFVFLPPLIFGEAMSLNWFHVCGAFFQAFVLAGPGVLIGAAIMGAVAKFALPYNWSWNLAMVFGSILSATDPVAVVALLKTAGASPKLTMVIVGESLMNDGTAMVLFTLFYRLLQGETFTAGAIIGFFAEAALGSSFLGVLCGLVVVRWLRLAHRPLKEADVTTQITITICSAYLIFYVAQGTLEISGVLACCGAGLMLAWLAPPIILNHESLHNVWSIIEWFANTLIFLLSGLIIGHRTLQHVRSIDWLYVVMLYVILMVTRAFIVAILFPFLSSKTHKCTVNEAVFISWAGLRGALAMALALIVEGGSSVDGAPVSEKSRLFFYVGGIAAMTLLFNAITAKSVLSALHLIDDNSVEKRIVMGQVKRRLRQKMVKLIDEMSKDLNPEEIEEVRQSMSLLRGIDGITGSGGKKDTHDISSPRFSFLSSFWSKNGPDESISPFSSKGAPMDDDVTLFGDFDNTKQEAPRKRVNSALSILSGSRNSYDRYANISRFLSVGNRNLQSNTDVIPDILVYMRGVFLEIVRVRYWHEIEAGKLPRVSHTAQFLLYSVDVGLDEVSGGLQDWGAIERNLVNTPWYIRLLIFLEANMFHWCFFNVLKLHKLLGRIEARRDKRAVYMLTSFIDAHEHAQSKIHGFLLGDDEVIDEEENGNMQLPEEIKVKAESVKLIERAKELLSKISCETVTAIRSKQISRTVLAKEAEMVKHMVEEGLLTSKHAEEFLETITHDVVEIESQRNRMYREQADLKAEKRRLVRISLTYTKDLADDMPVTSPLLIARTSDQLM